MLGRLAWTAGIDRSSWSWSAHPKVWRVWGSASPVPPRPPPSHSRLAPFVVQVAALAEPSPRTGQMARRSPASRRRLTWRVPVPSEHLGGSTARRLVSCPTPPRPASEHAAQSFFTPAPPAPRRAAEEAGREGVAAALRAGRKPIRPLGSRNAAATGQTRTTRGPGCSGGGSSARVASTERAPVGHAF